MSSELDTLSGVRHFLFLMDSDRMSGRMRPVLFWGLALIAILAGFADLTRGGITIGPILLVIGYCILIPVAILN